MRRRARRRHVGDVAAQIFISFSSKDNALAHTVADWPREAGIHGFFVSSHPKHRIRGGEHWERILYRELAVCRVFLPLISQHWLASGTARLSAQRPAFTAPRPG